MPPFFFGAGAFLQVGYRFRVSEGFALRLYGQPVAQYNFVHNGSTSLVGSNVEIDLTGDTVADHQFRFVYNVNLGVEIRL